jgi:hypothetical protein
VRFLSHMISQGAILIGDGLGMQGLIRTIFAADNAAMIGRQLRDVDPFEGCFGMCGIFRG